MTNVREERRARAAALAYYVACALLLGSFLLNARGWFVADIIDLHVRAGRFESSLRIISWFEAVGLQMNLAWHAPSKYPARDYFNRGTGWWSQRARPQGNVFLSTVIILPSYSAYSDPSIRTLKIQLHIGYLLILASFGLLVFIRWRKLKSARRQLAIANHRCAKCGYDLRGTPLRCPECGTQAPGSTAS